MIPVFLTHSSHSSVLCLPPCLGVLRSPQTSCRAAAKTSNLIALWGRALPWSRSLKLPSPSAGAQHPSATTEATASSGGVFLSSCLIVPLVELCKTQPPPLSLKSASVNQTCFWLLVLLNVVLPHSTTPLYVNSKKPLRNLDLLHLYQVTFVVDYSIRFAWMCCHREIQVILSSKIQVDGRGQHPHLQLRHCLH